MTINCILLNLSQKGDKPPRISGYVNHVIENLSDKEFHSHFRIPYEAFDYLLAKLSPHLQSQKPGPANVPSNVQLLSTIWLLATPDSYRSVGERFDLSKSTLSKCFIRVVKALCNLAPQHIKFPQRNEFN
nr:uncharacterized protein LOC111420404 [Onthophagus taurus]